MTTKNMTNMGLVNRNIRALAALAALTAAVCSCDKAAEFEHGIGLLSEYNNLSADGGTTPIPVYSNTSWTVRFLSEASWASIDRLSGSGMGQVKFSWEPNYGRSRYVELEFAGGGETSVIKMYQKCGIADSDVILEWGRDTVQVAAGDTSVELPFSTNLVYQTGEMAVEAVYPDGGQSQWVASGAVSADKVTLTINSNATGEERSAKIFVRHTDGGATYDSATGTTLSSLALELVQSR